MPRWPICTDCLPWVLPPLVLSSSRRPVTDLSYEDKSFIERPVDLGLNLHEGRAVTLLARGMRKYVQFFAWAQSLLQTDFLVGDAFTLNMHLVLARKVFRDTRINFRFFNISLDHILLLKFARPKKCALPGIEPTRRNANTCALHVPET